MPNNTQVDCTMCRQWRLAGCRLNDLHYPDAGHLCPRFDLDYSIEDGESQAYEPHHTQRDSETDR